VENKKTVLAGVLVLAAFLTAPREAAAYSVLAHEANIDALWDSTIQPLLAKKFPRATREQLKRARAFAYGGSVIQDLGYYPFGNHFFSNLLHYVRSGDFVETMIHEARDIDEYGFALGALAHYAADNAGHPEAVNRAVALMFPKLRAKYGNVVTYEQSPASHIIVEFSFDVVQAASGAYASEAYHDFIGFEVAKPLLERTFQAVYGLQMKDVFLNEDLAIGSYRHAISNTIPAITRIAWRDKREAIQQLKPDVAEQRFVFNLSRRDYERDFGRDYQRAGPLTMVLKVLYRLLPKIGPLRPLKFRAPTPEAEALFLASFKDTRQRYQATLHAVAERRLNLVNTNFDIGKPSTHGEYALADETYADLLDRLAGRHFTGVPAALRQNILAYYVAAPDKVSGKKERKRLEKIRVQLSSLKSQVSKAPGH
jgi:Zinc dependent phospholipase C